MTKFGLAGVLALMASASGCLTMGTVQTADTLGKGHFQVSAEPGIWGLGARNPNGSISTPSNIPHVDAAFRYGVNDRLDLGIRSGFSLIELQAKVLLTDPQAETLAMSLAPTLGFGFFSVTDPTTLQTTGLTYGNLGIPLLIGIKHLNGNELVFGPRINNILFNYTLTSGASSQSSVGYLFGIGGSLGYCISIGEIFKILPEFAINIPVAAIAAVANVGSGSAGGIFGLIYQFKLGLLFGRTGHKPQGPEYSPPPLPGPPPPMPPPAGGDDVPPPPPPLPAPSG